MVGFIILRALVLIFLLAVSPAFAKDWAPLSQTERANLVSELHGTHGNLIVACASLSCRQLAIDIAAVFSSAGWSVRHIDHGGLGIDGISGIRADSCGIGAQKLRADVEKATTRKVTVVEDGKCADPTINLVIGNPV